MKQQLLSIAVHGKKDLVLLRQRTRQLAALLGYDAEDQAILAAGVFDQACAVHRRCGRSVWKFWVQDRHLCIDSAPGQQMPISKRLPEKAMWSHADIQWIVTELHRLAPLDPFGEIQKLNHELLEALLAARQHRLPKVYCPAA